MKKIILITILVFFAFLVTSQDIAFGEGGIAWGTAGKPVCTARNTQQKIRMIPDGSGGAIIVWEDWRNGEADIYAQRINGNGDRLWGEYGVAVSTAQYGQKNPVIVGDGSGGAIIAWEDYAGSNPTIYAVRVNGATGETYTGWPSTGVVLYSLTLEYQIDPDIVSDGNDGAIITWQQEDSIWAHRIDGNGTPKWVGAVIVSSGTAVKERPKIINDGIEYVIIVWEDRRDGNSDIYAQRVLISNGAAEWGSSGKPVSVVIGNQINPQIVPDGEGGAIITWTDDRNGNPDIYAQRIDSNGVARWDTDGIPICKEVNEQSNPFIMNDLVGGTTQGAIIAWEDKREDSYGDIYAEKVPLDVSLLSTGNGKAMATGSQIQKCPRLVSDNQGGGIITWIENDPVNTQYEIFASKRNQNGDPVWSIYPGVQVCQASDIIEHQMVNDGSGGVIIAWVSKGPDGDYNIYAQRVVEDGTMPTSASISGRVTLPDVETGIPGVEVEAFKDGELKYSVFTDIYGKYGITGLVAYSTYTVRATWMCNDIVSSVSKETFAPSYGFDFTLEIAYELGTIAGNVSGVEREAKRVSGSGLYQSLSPGSGIAFVELEQRGKAIVRVPVEADGNYNIPNLLPGRFVARAYNGSIYSSPRTLNLKEGETLRVDFAFGIMPEETVYNHPNPAKDGLTTIRYYCGYSNPEAEIKIYNIAGELVRKVKDNEINRDGTDPHIYRFLWDCKNSSGKDVASGVYIYAVEVKEKSSGEIKKVIKRMAVIK